jgi:hypothetical protein
MNLNTKYAAGIIPYSRDSAGELSFLLGYENGKWSGFIGKYEDSDNENIINTAIREFNEETAYIFNEFMDIIKNKLIHNDSRLIITKSYNNSRIIYIYFINIHNSVLEYPFENDFLNNRKSSYLNECKEKSQIKWIKYTDLESFHLIHGLRKILIKLNNY